MVTITGSFTEFNGSLRSMETYCTDSQIVTSARLTIILTLLTRIVHFLASTTGPCRLTRPNQSPVTLRLRYEPEDDGTEKDLEIEVVMLASDVWGDRALATESDLHKRFPGTIPRFWHGGYSDLLIVDEDQIDPSSDYLCIEIPIGRSSPSSQNQSSSQPPSPSSHHYPKNEECDISQPPPKRPKESSDQPQSTMKAYIPHFICELNGLSSVKQHLKDSARRSEVLFGFVISLLGGALHLSYPPTLDEAKLHCEITMLHETYDLPMSTAPQILDSTLAALNLPQPVPIQPPPGLIADLTEFVWLSCSQSQHCLSFLVPHLTKPTTDFTSFLQRLLPFATLNLPRFLELARFDVDDRAGKFPRVWTSHLELSKQLLESHVINYKDASFKIFDRIDSSVHIPPHLFSLSSSVVDKAGKKSVMRRLVHKDLLVRRWPYFKIMLSSGLSESTSQSAELPFSDIAIEWLMKPIYDRFDDEVPREAALEFAELGPQFGLFESLEETNKRMTSLNVLPRFNKLIENALKTAFDETADAINLSHSVGAHGYWKDILEPIVRQCIKQSNCTLELAPGLHPDIVAAAQALALSLQLFPSLNE